MSSLVIKDISKRFGAYQALESVSIEAESGEFLVLLGPSGCGKSTLLNMIAGLETVTEGQIRIDGEVVNDRDPKDRDIAMVFQSYALYPSMTVRENISFGMRVRRVPKPQQAESVNRVAKMLQLEALLDRRPSQLSGGQRQRVAMGRALVRDPKVFLFDEPLSNLDAKLRVEMRTEIKKLHKKLGVTIVYVTHDQIEAMTLATKVVVMRQARIQQVGSPQEIYDRPQNLYVASFIGSPPMNLIPGTLLENGGQVAVETTRENGAKLTVPMGRATPATAQYLGRKIILGARPEIITEPGTHYDGATPYRFEARIEVIEPTGSDNLAIISLGGIDAIARLRPGAGLVGKPMSFSIDTSKALLFDPQTEQRIA
ncbi:MULTISPECIES: sn-glycerol-3-phosphate ABC transporter ATP-binding protein UgpC [Mesorhizobium]|uniref:ABC transporter ATP-binding protein n=1 Tax=Mesorhizobium TaxID=68287 RepID=UPI0007EE2754|nr:MULTISPECIES: sn-glycerol-3-phosphate ABC transporter ATP-binding protein UgpC [Mesorhizobium]PBB52940.1 sugar ABC transporter ATP-binding protein [Mesorhizobium loti]QIA22526.1 sn-glycerol-3-phosphate ABC transporter ATP-binding protein UgpC [Mesorhizobium sp. AA22]